MRGQQRTAWQLIERETQMGGVPKNVDSLTWLADWRAVGLPYCSVYVIAPLDGWPCKIGISTSAYKRLVQLQTSVWKQLEVKWCGWLPSVKDARSLEKRCHTTLTDTGKWLHGEWFDLRPDKAIELVEFEAALAGVSPSTELPPGVSRDFVQKLFDARYQPGYAHFDKYTSRVENAMNWELEVDSEQLPVGGKRDDS